MAEYAISEILLDSRYKVTVIRTSPYRSEWSIHDGNQVLDRQNVGFSYGALFGSAVEDVADWQQCALRFIDGMSAL